MFAAWHHTKRISKAAGKHTVRFLLPPLWHYVTDEYKGRFHHLVVDSILALMMMSLLAINIGLVAWFYVFSIPAELNVSLQINTDHVVSGAELPVDVMYRVGSKDVSDVIITVHGPQGWQINSSDSQHTFTTIAAGTEDSIHITAPFITNVDRTNRILVIYEYKYFGQQYYGSSEVTFSAPISNFEIIPHIPDKILTTEEAVLQFEYVNSSDTARKRTCIELKLPENFTMISTSHEIVDGQICFETLGPREHGVIEIVGTFQNAIGEGQRVIEIVAYDYLGNIAYMQSKLQTSIQVLTPRLAVATTGSEVINVGDSVQYSVVINNTGDATLTNVAVSAPLRDFANRVSSVTPIDGSRVGDQLQWIISELPPNESTTRTFVVQTNPAWREKNVNLEYSVSATADIEDIGVSTYTTSVYKGIKFNSTLDFSVIGRYTTSTGEQLGYGPYPMEADNITALRVIWEIQDFTNDLNNVTIQTTLPSQVEWTGLTSVTEGTKIIYDPATRTVTWHASSIPSFSHGQGAQFEVRVSPNSQQIGKQINITNNTIFSARDNHTGSIMTRNIEALRTAQPINASSN